MEETGADHIQLFNPNSLVLPFTMIILGKSKSGKTEQLHRIMYALYKKYKKSIEGVYLFSQTSKINKDLKRLSTLKMVIKTWITSIASNVVRVWGFQGC